MTPTANNLLLREIKQKLKTDSGIILQSEVSTGNKPAYVEAVGAECKEIQPGDTIYCDWKQAIAVTVDGNQGVLLPETAVYGYERG